MRSFYYTYTLILNLFQDLIPDIIFPFAPNFALSGLKK